MPDRCGVAAPALVPLAPPAAAATPGDRSSPRRLSRPGWHPWLLGRRACPDSCVHPGTGPCAPPRSAWRGWRHLPGCRLPDAAPRTAPPRAGSCPAGVASGSPRSAGMPSRNPGATPNAQQLLRPAGGTGLTVHSPERRLRYVRAWRGVGRMAERMSRWRVSPRPAAPAQRRLIQETTHTAVGQGQSWRDPQQAAGRYGP